MVNPPPRALQRRAAELEASAERELKHDLDSGALLLFYAAECALKAVYMYRNNLRDTADARANAAPVRSYGHDLIKLLTALNIPRSRVAGAPTIVLQRTKQPGSPSVLHEAWRYGERIDETPKLCEWLRSITNWCRDSV